MPPSDTVPSMELSVVMPPENDEKVSLKKTGERETNLLYGINENPPWYLCIFLAFQHYLTMVSGLLFLSGSGSFFLIFFGIFLINQSSDIYVQSDHL